MTPSDALPLDQDVALPPPVPSFVQAKPRLWSALLLGFLALACVVVLSGSVSYLVLVASGELDPKQPSMDEEVYTAAIGLLHGLSIEDVGEDKLTPEDADYQVIVTGCAVKTAPAD